MPNAVFALATATVRTNPPPPILPKVRLTGIVTFGDRELAFLKLQPITGSTVVEESCMLAPGERSGELEVIDIDDHAGRVRIKISGVMMDLTFAGPSPVIDPPAR